ncbi:hypothetical protein pipiens_010406 [Culex pipiens pipiens]|uniref:Uncharacterized protein n=1 Tax=Culex pipiens pipiens TaxID=38569 RepID=A0ABD1DAE3_CULPP
MFDVPLLMLSNQPARRATLSRKCIQLALRCHQPASTPIDFVSCSDLSRTFNASLYPEFLDNTYVPLNADNPINETLLTVCHESFQKGACTVRIYRPNDNAFLLIADVHFRDKRWQWPDTGCDCSRFKRLFVERETAHCKNAEAVSRTSVAPSLLAVVWTGFFVAIVSVSFATGTIVSSDIESSSATAGVIVEEEDCSTPSVAVLRGGLVELVEVGGDEVRQKRVDNSGPFVHNGGVTGRVG